LVTLREMIHFALRDYFASSKKFALAAIPEIKARIKPVSSAREDDKCPLPLPRR